ncbi:caspase family protein [Methylobacterium sp. WL7]|uniref:caspase family protein n=1 Tax=Methylobacterium sp. WL7 TaxID=2603900 RepID=UPI0011C851FE|nr:caspase family protein [Methylobacterium sp. WL7]TXN43216.1 caspase family protein [Methylobacterium sp. WL7]
MIRSAVTIIVSAVLMLFVEQAVAEGRRVALVVGIGGYENVPKLPNAVSDATAMADLFRKAGFEVVAARNDTSNLEFKRAIREFEDAVADSDIAVVYYAGHGVEIRDANYLIPTDAKFVNERDAEDEAIPLDRVLGALEAAKRLRLVILDACRDNPFASKIKRRVATRAISAGLGKVEPQQTDTLIAYAAKAQAVANDGEGAHSPFTTALLANLTVPGLDVRLAFGRVRDDVLKATNRQQEPFVYGSLGGGTVALVPARVEVPVTAPNSALMANTRDETVLAKSDYEIVERVGSKAAWEVYLNTHKAGLYADLARMQLAKLAAPGAAGVSQVALRGDPDVGGEARPRISPHVDAPSAAPTPRPTAAEFRAWNRLKASTDAGAIANFIETYKTSPLIPEAQERLAKVELLAREKEERLRQEREVARQRDEDEQHRKAAEDERKRLDREAARQREEAEKAMAAEAARQKAEVLATAKQREAEVRARAAEALAHRREEEEAARVAEVARRKREAEERAAALVVERALIEAEIATRKREIEEASRTAAVVKAAREAEEQARRQAEKDREREAAEQAKVQKREQAQAAAEVAAREAEARERAKAVELAFEQREAEKRERAKAAELAAKQQEAEERRKALEISQLKAAAEQSAQDKSTAELTKTAEVERRKAAAAAAAERHRAEEAAAVVAEQKAERAAAASRREAADERRRAAENAAAVNRRKAEAAARRVVERAAANEQRRRAAKLADRAQAIHTARPKPAPQGRSEARAAAPQLRSSGGGSTIVGIGF